MPHIIILSSSVRRDRKSHRVALFFKNYVEDHQQASVEIVDLMELNFPVFHERLSHEKDPDPSIVHFSGVIRSADAVLIITPEYNGGYPAALKNCIDLLYDEWHHKPVAIATVSKGAFGGAQVITSLQFVLWKMHALVVPAMFPVPDVNHSFDENGKPSDPEKINKRAEKFIHELLWMTEAVRRMSHEEV